LKATVVTDTPEMRRLEELTKQQSQVSRPVILMKSGGALCTEYWILKDTVETQMLDVYHKQ
jgi:hypothetical protein